MHLACCVLLTGSLVHDADPERYQSAPEIALESIPYVKVRPASNMCTAGEWGQRALSDCQTDTQDNLAAAEHANRAAEYRIVYAAYKNVAQFFADAGKSRKAIKFFQKCLEIAVQVRARPLA